MRYKMNTIINKKIIFLLVIILAIGCNSYRETKIAPKKRYRDLNPTWDGTSSKKVINTFENYYKYDFNNRFLDDCYLLCHFLSYTEIKKDSLPSYLPDINNIINEYKNAKLIFLEIKPVQVYLPKLGDVAPLLWEEYIKENSEHFQNYLAGKYKPSYKYLYMLISEDEVPKIKASIRDMSLNLTQYEPLFIDGQYSKDTAESMINFYYGEYDLSKLRPYEFEVRYYDSISKSLRNK